MNVEERIARIEALETEFDEKIKALKVEVLQEDEFPQIGRGFYVITPKGKVTGELWGDDDFDRSALAIGNVFRTREQAEFAVEKLKVEAELRKFSRPFKRDNQNYCIELCSPYKSISAYSYEQSQMQGVIYFESLEKAQQAVNKVGEYRIKKYIFGVED